MHKIETILKNYNQLKEIMLEPGVTVGLKNIKGFWREMLWEFEDAHKSVHMYNKTDISMVRCDVTVLISPLTVEILLRNLVMSQYLCW